MAARAYVAGDPIQCTAHVLTLAIPTTARRTCDTAGVLYKHCSIVCLHIASASL